MARVYQVPRHAFIWLMIAAVLVVIPHFWHGPAWLLVVVPVLFFWRVLVQQGRLRMPGRAMRLVLLLVMVALTLYFHGTLLGPEAGVALLVAAFALKMLEMFRQRDAFVVIVLACFVLASSFLFTRDPITTFYNVIVMIVIMAALVGINHSESGISPWQHLRPAAALVIQALPLMLILFLLVPRLPPLWSLPNSQQQAKTGMSDSMSPGEISRLSQSSELAFRVEFDGAIPAPAQRYWRGLTYSWFDGRRWSQAVPPSVHRDEYIRFPGAPEPDWYRAMLAERGEAVWRYRVIMPRSGRQWLYALAVPFSDKPDVGLARDLRLVYREDIEATIDYQVQSYRMPVATQGLAEWEWQINLSLPTGSNLRARTMAREWRDEESDDLAFIRRVLNWFNQESFYYTLEPPLLGEHTVDDFLFRTRRGFCEHYASSFALMLRAAGIPARIVAGYQGGELNPLGNYLLVRQRDAHAWVEAWLPGQGWVEFDPTMQVAPNRIEMGLDQALAGSGQQRDIGIADAMRNNPLLTRLSYMADYVDFVWAKWVLGYNQQNQMEFLSRWLGKITPQRLALALAGTGGGVLVVLMLWMLWRSRSPALSWWQYEYRRMQRLLRRRGIDAQDHMTPQQMIEGAAARYPAIRRALIDWRRSYDAAAYQPEQIDQKSLQRELVTLRRRIARAMLASSPK